MPKKTLKNNNGYSVLLGVVVVGAIVLTTVLTLSQVSINSIKQTRVNLASSKSQLLAENCAEIALREIRNDQNYTGSETFSYENGECSYNVLDLGSEVEVRVSGGYKDSQKYIKINIPNSGLQDLSEYTRTEPVDLEL